MVTSATTGKLAMVAHRRIKCPVGSNVRVLPNRWGNDAYATPGETTVPVMEVGKDDRLVVLNGKEIWFHTDRLKEVESHADYERRIVEAVCRVCELPGSECDCKHGGTFE